MRKRRLSLEARMQRRQGYSGRLRIAAAEILRDFFRLDNINAEDINVVKGYWRISPYVDVYRWEIFVCFTENFMIGFGCWQTLTKFVPLARKNGIVVSKKSPHEIGALDANERVPDSYYSEWPEGMFKPRRIPKRPV